MLWWVAAGVVWLVSAVWILSVMADVFRGKSSVFSAKVVPGYAFHGATAVLALFLIGKALGQWSSPGVTASGEGRRR